MDLTDGVRAGVENIEETLNNFFRNVKAKISDFESRNAPSDGLHYYDQPEKQLISDLQKAQAAFRAALCDSFNTPESLDVLLTLVSQTNVYLQARPRPQNVSALRTTAEWITRMLRMFGLGEGQAVLKEGAIGWGEASTGEDSGVDVSCCSYIGKVFLSLIPCHYSHSAGSSSYALLASTVIIPR